jgi:GNAT superfamily N-acetyltransferase
MPDPAQQQIEARIFTAPEFRRNFTGQLAPFMFGKTVEKSDHTFVVVSKGDVLAGFAKLEETKDDYYLACLEVRKDFQGQRLSHILLNKIFSMAADTGRSILLSGYTADGARCLRNQVQRLKIRFPALSTSHENY